MMKKKLNLITIILIVFSVILGCDDKPKMYLFFLDESLSASTLEVMNMVRIESLILEEALKMKSKDLLKVYPIHSYTGSAGSLLKLKGPKLKGDLRDKKRLLEWKKNVVKPEIKGIWTEKIARNRRTKTSLFPVVEKIHNGMRNGYEVIPIIVSDMINDTNSESFTKLFSKKEFDSKKYAKQKTKELGYTEKLSGVKVFVKIPGTPHGDGTFEVIKRQVLDFWVEFFNACGAVVVHEDL